MTESSTAKSPAGRVWAAVAFKGPVGGKRRLAGLLSPEERMALGLAMLEDVLDALLAAPSVETILLVTPDAHPPDHLIRDRIRRVLDPAGAMPASGDGLNPAFRLAQQLASEANVTSLLLMPADLPTIRVADLSAVLGASKSSGVVMAPDRAAGGTNALLLRPPAALPPSFGEDSFERHRRLANEAGIEPVVVRRTALALDLDVPDDVAALLAGGVDCRARRLLIEIGAEARLEGLASAQTTHQARSATT